MNHEADVSPDLAAFWAALAEADIAALHVDAGDVLDARHTCQSLCRS
ncbi:MAG: hypothetical protein LUG99_17405 [Lachnospiraceae bacterium]|nr:hypothetical protein [Lachnospiraceae bacterium]